VAASPARPDWAGRRVTVLRDRHDLASPRGLRPIPGVGGADGRPRARRGCERAVSPSESGPATSCQVGSSRFRATRGPWSVTPRGRRRAEATPIRCHRAKAPAPPAAVSGGIVSRGREGRLRRWPRRTPRRQAGANGRARRCQVPSVHRTCRITMFPSYSAAYGSRLPRAVVAQIRRAEMLIDVGVPAESRVV